ncbi:hypothetical protein HanRHA438_Chr13g0595781 [Helianthus annuus]|nr:hypothetical protein HanRHA438_Chr13g0595781 [Helianthus annuus]
MEPRLKRLPNTGHPGGAGGCLFPAIAAFFRRMRIIEKRVMKDTRPTVQLNSIAALFWIIC